MLFRIFVNKQPLAGLVIDRKVFTNRAKKRRHVGIEGNNKLVNVRKVVRVQIILARI